MNRMLCPSVKVLPVLPGRNKGRLHQYLHSANLLSLGDVLKLRLCDPSITYPLACATTCDMNNYRKRVVGYSRACSFGRVCHRVEGCTKRRVGNLRHWWSFDDGACSSITSWRLTREVHRYGLMTCDKLMGLRDATEIDLGVYRDHRLFVVGILNNLGLPAPLDTHLVLSYYFSICVRLVSRLPWLRYLPLQMPKTSMFRQQVKERVPLPHPLARSSQPSTLLRLAM